MTTNTNLHVDHASAAVQAATKTDHQKVNVARDLVAAASKHPLWAVAADVQTAGAAWTKAADALEANAARIAELKSSLAIATAKQRSSRRDWRAAKKQMLGAVDVFTEGSADETRAFGFAVRTRAPK